MDSEGLPFLLDSMLEVNIEEQNATLSFPEENSEYPNNPPSTSQRRLSPNRQPASQVTKDEMHFYKEMFPEVLNVNELRIHCTACDRHIGCGPNMLTIMRGHPLLRVLYCSECIRFYGRGTFPRDSDGSETFCRWCAQGGQVFCCSFCPNVFCKKCIRRNLGQICLKEIERSDDWACFSCDVRPLWQQRALYHAILQLMKQLQRQERFPTVDISPCCQQKRRIESSPTASSIETPPQHVIPSPHMSNFPSSRSEHQNQNYKQNNFPFKTNNRFGSKPAKLYPSKTSPSSTSSSSSSSSSSMVVIQDIRSMRQDVSKSPSSEHKLKWIYKIMDETRKLVQTLSRVAQAGLPKNTNESIQLARNLRKVFALTTEQMQSLDRELIRGIDLMTANAFSTTKKPNPIISSAKTSTSINGKKRTVMVDLTLDDEEEQPAKKYCVNKDVSLEVVQKNSNGQVTKSNRQPSPSVTLLKQMENAEYEEVKMDDIKQANENENTEKEKLKMNEEENEQISKNEENKIIEDDSQEENKKYNKETVEKNNDIDISITKLSGSSLTISNISEDCSQDLLNKNDSTSLEQENTNSPQELLSAEMECSKTEFENKEDASDKETNLNEENIQSPKDIENNENQAQGENLEINDDFKREDNLETNDNEGKEEKLISNEDIQKKENLEINDNVQKEENLETNDNGQKEEKIISSEDTQKKENLEINDNVQKEENLETNDTEQKEEKLTSNEDIQKKENLEINDDVKREENLETNDNEQKGEILTSNEDIQKKENLEINDDSRGEENFKTNDSGQKEEKLTSNEEIQTKENLEINDDEQKEEQLISNEDIQNKDNLVTIESIHKEESLETKEKVHIEESLETKENIQMDEDLITNVEVQEENLETNIQNEENIELNIDDKKKENVNLTNVDKQEQNLKDDDENVQKNKKDTEYVNEIEMEEIMEVESIEKDLIDDDKINYTTDSKVDEMDIEFDQVISPMDIDEIKEESSNDTDKTQTTSKVETEGSILNKEKEDFNFFELKEIMNVDLDNLSESQDNELKEQINIADSSEEKNKNKHNIDDIQVDNLEDVLLSEQLLNDQEDIENYEISNKSIHESNPDSKNSDEIDNIFDVTVENPPLLFELDCNDDKKTSNMDSLNIEKETYTSNELSIKSPAPSSTSLNNTPLSCIPDEIE